jgi:hypothetical protein
VAVGDFNGDGKPDVVTANSSGNNVTVVLGNGSGTFTPASGSPFAVGTNPQFVAVADFNGDGKPDLVTANTGGNNITVLLGNGSGGFTPAAGSPFTVGVSPICVAAGDFNGDGKLDIVVANSGDNTLTVLLGNGSGGFTPAGHSPFSVGGHPQSLAVADFNKDGKLDIVVVNAGDNTVTELLGDGAGGFAAAMSSPFSVGTNPQAIAAGDFNGDGKPDLVTANQGSNNVTELLGDGAGGFTPAPGSPFAAGIAPQSLAAADFNGDGNKDLAVADSGNNAATVLFGDGTGGFTPAAGGTFALGLSPQSVAVADFNGDGQPDFVTANLNGNTASVLLNSLPAIVPNIASLTFYGAAGQFASVFIPVSVTSASAGSNYTVSSNQPWLVPSPASNATGGVIAVNLSASAASLAAGLYTAVVRYSAPNFFGGTTNVIFSVAHQAGGLQAATGSPLALGTTPAAMAVGDFNGDGHLDLVTANTGNTVTVLLGDGTGAFTPAAGGPFAVGSSPSSVALGDFNGDGHLDLVTANFVDNTITVLLGDGTGALTPAAGSPYAVGTSPVSVAVADFNRDGIPDIVTANDGSNNLTVLVGDGAGGFTPASGSPFPAGLFPQSIAVGDFNGDGKPDVVEANSGDNTIRVLLGDGAGRLTGAGAYNVGSLPHSVAVADVNGDGYLDIFTANPGSNSVTVLLGNGTGAFAAAPGGPFTVGSNPQSVAVADFDGDGNPDIVTANNGGNSVSVLLGNGSGGFVAAAGSPFTAGTTPISAVTGDFDGTGDTDIAIASVGGGGTITVLMGTRAASTSVLSTTANSTIVYGTTLPLTLTVTGGYGAPTGTATFLDGGVAIGTSIQSTSPFLFSVTGLGAGVHSLTATYGGNTAYSGSTSNTLSITVTQANQTITFGALLNKGVGAAPFNINATASSGLAVIFASLTSSVCTISGATVTLVTTGTCTIQAAQPGNGNYSAANPVSQSFMVTPQANQTITFSSLANQVFGSSPFPVSATASSGLAVSFTSTTLPVCTMSGATVTLVSGGNCTIQAAQAGNATYAPATPVTQSFTVTPKNQTITFGALANKTFGSAAFTVTATASSGLAVSFVSNTPSVCTVAVATVTLVSTGTCTIEASQAGNNNYSAAAVVDQSFTVSPGTQTITFGALASKPYGTAPFTLTATASSGLPVSFTSTTSSVCTVAVATVTLVSAGTCTIQASQAGNSNYAAAATVTQNLTVTTGHQTITFAALPNVPYGTAPFSLTATASSGLAVSFATSTSTVCTVASGTVTVVSAGTCTIQATQAGNTNYAAATAVSQSFTVTPAAQTITFGSLSNQTLGAAPITISATASSGLTVTFTSTTSQVCTVTGTTVKLVTAGTCTIQAAQGGNNEYAAAPTVNQSFTISLQSQTITFASIPNQAIGATLTVSATASSGLTVSFKSTTTSICTVNGTSVKLLLTGTCTVEASQSGNSSFSAATPVDQTFTIAPSTQTITFATLADRAFETASFTVTATASSSLAVTFASTTTSVCTVNGAAVTLLAVGTCTIQATQAGNGTYAAATPVNQSFNVTQATQTITFAAIPNKALGTAPFTLSATASSTLTVSFASNSSVCTVSGTTVTLVLAGTCTIQATQGGNATYSAATPVQQSFTVTPANQTITFAALPSQPLGTFPFVVSATASSGLPVIFISNTTSICTVSNAGLTWTVTLLAKGNCTIEATQPGSSNYSPATPVSQTFPVVAGTLTLESVVNAGSYAALPIAADECAVAFGIDFATTTAQTNSLSLSKTLAGTGVTITDSAGTTKTALLFYASETQINLLVPEGLALGAGTVTVINSASKKVSLPVTIGTVAPSLFTADSSGTGAPAAIALTFTAGNPTAQSAPVFSCGGSSPACTATPINVRTPSTQVYLELFGTGIRGRSGLAGVSVTVDGVPLQVLYAGAQSSYAGLDQVNVLLNPSLAGSGSQTLQLTVDGIAANPVTINIQ